MANVDELVDFEQGGDTGEADSASIQPIDNSEVASRETFRRPSENLRGRSEVLRQVVEDLMYKSDYARDTVMRCAGLFTLTKIATGPDRYSLVPSEPLFVMPALSPGYQSGGREKGARLFVGGQPYVGTIPDELKIVASSQYTAQRGYSDGDTLDDGAMFSLGANGITIELVPVAVPGGLLSISAVVDGAPRRHVKISYGTNATATTANDLVTFINTDINSQGGWGLRHLFRASTTTGTGAFTAALSPTKLQGGYDAEMYEVTTAQFTDFFLTVANQLQEGDSLAIGFPAGAVEIAGLSGGRRQSIIDLPTDRVGGSSANITPAVGSKLFNTAREPEKIPYAVPIGKLFAGEFVFIDGTRVDISTPVALGESIATLGRFASTVAPTGAESIGYGGSGAWNADQVAAPTTLPTGPLEAALDAVPGQLALDTPNQSGARRIGAEALAGTVSTGNRAVALPQGSIRQQLAALANQAPSTTVGGGVNRRVNEDGHELKGRDPINKAFLGLADGGRRFGAMLRRTQNVLASRLGPTDYADLVLQPFEVSGILTIQETVEAGVDPDMLKLNGPLISTRFANIWPVFPKYAVAAIDDALDSGLVPFIFVLVEGLVSPDNSENGLYIFEKFTDELGPNLGQFQLRKIDMSVSANFSAVTSFAAATATFLTAQYKGSTSSLTKLGIHQTPGSKYTAISVGVGGPENAWLEVLGPPAVPVFTAGEGQLAERLSYFAGGLAVWDPGGATPRDTRNILGGVDKALLDGSEDNAPVNATASHHHGPNYTRWYSVPHVEVTWVGSGSNLVSFTGLSAANGDYFQGPIVSGAPDLIILGYQLEVRIRATYNAGDPAGTAVAYIIESSPTVVFDPTATVATFVQNKRSYKPIAGAAFDEYITHMTLPCNGTRNISMKATSVSAGIDLVGSDITVRIIAIHTQYAPPP